MAAAIRQTGMEEDAYDLRRCDEGCRPSRCKLERLQRKPGAVQLRQMRDVDRCHRCRLLRDQPEGFAGRRQGWLRAGAECGAGKERQLAVGVESRYSRRLEEGRRRGKIHRMGNQQGLHQARRFERRMGQRPAGTRTSLYPNAEYFKGAPFAQLTLASIDAADPNKPTVQPVPYVGVQYAAIPEFQGIGTTVGKQFSAALSGSSTV